MIREFQSTLPRRERRPELCRLPHQYYISIHAPAKGATEGLFLDYEVIQYFNPRSREGSDGTPIAHAITAITISIHAPAKGATERPEYRIFADGISIHAPAKGAT